MRDDKEKKKDQVMQAFGRVYDTVAKLRDPNGGCPWDLEQTFQSLRSYLIEEAYEASQALADVNSEKESQAELCDELGDVLLQVLLNAQLADDAKYFNAAQVADNLNAKLIRRHPHVFGDGNKLSSSKEVLSQWGMIKKEERKEQEKKEKGFFQAQGVDKIFPASLKAEKIGKLAASIHFDWPDTSAVMAQCFSEMDELKAEWEICQKSGKIRENLLNEIGDIYFSLAHVCRHLGQSPELIAEKGNKKFLNRFAAVEELVKQKGLELRSAGTEVLEQLWLAAKQNEKQS